METRIFSMMVALAPDSGIGHDNLLLYNDKEDIELFKRTTMGKNVIMGRKTYFSIPEKFRPLKGRGNFVISRSNIKIDGVTIVNDPFKYEWDQHKEELVVIGGGEIYKLFFPRTKKIYLSQFHNSPGVEANVFFPNPLQFYVTEKKEYKNFTFNQLEYLTNH